MPQIFRIGAYVIYFWANGSDPLEPVHVHMAKGTSEFIDLVNSITDV